MSRQPGTRIRNALGELGELLARHQEPADFSTFATYADDPVGFLTEVLGEQPWRRQVEIAEAVRDCPLVTVRSCHAAGKDWIAARLALWWVYARRGLVLLTGPTRAQVEEILMRGELREAFGRAADLPGDLHVRALRPAGEGKAGVLAKTASGVSRLTGFHDARVLFVVTEAQDPEISHAWDAAFACTTGAKDRILTLGNPTERNGRFYRAHRNPEWRALKIAASDVPNVRHGETVVPGLLTREGVDRFAREYGEESGFYVSRVLAEFPEESEEGVFRREWLDQAVALFEAGKLTEEAREATPVAALDPSRHGPDASVLMVRRGNVLWGSRTWTGRHDTTQLVERVTGALEGFGIRPRGHEDGASGLVVVDEVGLGGGALDRLVELGYRTHGYNGGRSAESDRHFNLRAESYWQLRSRLERGELALPRMPELEEELLALQYRVTPQGQTQLEAKRDLKGRIGRSPDRADALAMLEAARELEVDPSGRDALTLGGYTVAEARAAGLLEDEGEWHGGSFPLPASPQHR
jgi:hypothetical protein